MKIKVPATSANLGPGFDSLGMALDLYNYIEFEKLPGKEIKMIIKGEGSDELPKNENNLLYQAYLRVFEYLKMPVCGIKLTMENNIPLARGLGSSAAAVVGGLVVANKILNEPLTTEELLKLAVEVEGHPDNVAPALLGGMVISGVSDNDIFYKVIKPGKSLRCSVLIPDFKLSTKAARSVLPESVSFKDAVFNVSRVALLIDAFHSDNYELLNIAIDDKLHQPYRSKLIPGLDEAFLRAKELGLLGISISGAGPTIIVFHKEGEEEKLNKLQEVFIKHDTHTKLLNLNPIQFGVS